LFGTFNLSQLEGDNINRDYVNFPFSFLIIHLSIAFCQKKLKAKLILGSKPIRIESDSPEPIGNFAEMLLNIARSQIYLKNRQRRWSQRFFSKYWNNSVEGNILLCISHQEQHVVFHLEVSFDDGKKLFLSVKVCLNDNFITLK